MEQFAPLQQARSATRFFIFLSLFLLFYSFGGLIGQIIIKAVCDCEIPDAAVFLQAVQEDPMLVQGIRVSVIFSQFLGFALPAFFFARLVNVDVLGELQLINRTSNKSYLIAAIIIIAALPMVNLMQWLNMQVDFPALMGETGIKIKEMEDLNTGISKLLLPQPGDVKTLLLVLIVLAITPAICEELVFRGVFQQLFTRAFRNKHLGVWVAAFVFSAMHFQFYGFLPRLVLGAVLGYLFAYSRTLWVPMVAHAINNTLSVLAPYFELDKGETLNTDTLGTSASDWIYVAISLLITVGLLIVFKKINKDIPDEPKALEPTT